MSNIARARVGTPRTERTGLGLIWVLAAALFTHIGVGLVALAVHGLFGLDFSLFWEAARNFIDHEPVYLDHEAEAMFVFPPSSVLFFAPFGFLPKYAALVVFEVVQVAALIALVGLSLAVVGLPWRSWQAAVLFVGLGLSLPVQIELEYENVNLLVALGLVSMLYTASRGRWTAAGALLGVSLALKPALLSLVLFPLLYKQWRGATISLLLALGLSVVVLPFIAEPGRFLTVVVPYLLHGEGPVKQQYNVSLAGIGLWFGAPSTLVLAVRVLVAAGIGVLLWVRLRMRSNDRALEMVEVAGLLILGTLLVSPLVLNLYTLWLIPLIATVYRPDALVRQPLAWLGVYLIAGKNAWPTHPIVHGMPLSNARTTVGLVLLAAACGVAVLSARRAAAVRVDAGASSFGLGSHST